MSSTQLTSSDVKVRYGAGMRSELNVEDLMSLAGRNLGNTNSRFQNLTSSCEKCCTIKRLTICSKKSFHDYSLCLSTQCLSLSTEGCAPGWSIQETL
jgi:hypothetical protein